MQTEQGGLRDRGVKRCSRRGVGDYGGECGGADIYGYMTVRGYVGEKYMHLISRAQSSATDWRFRRGFGD